MKKLKIIFSLVMVLFLTGCTVDYNIVVKTDHKIDEEIIISESVKSIENKGYSIDEVIDSKKQSYEADIKKYKFTSKYKTVNDYVIATFKSKNKKLKEFVRFPYFQKMFNSADIVDSKDNFSFKTNGEYYQAGLFYDLSGIVDEGFVDKININIQFHNKVVSSNADSYNSETNTYTWILTKDTVEKSIEFELSNEKRNDLIIKYFYKNNKSKIIVTTILIIGVLVLIITYLVIKKKNNNL